MRMKRLLSELLSDQSASSIELAEALGLTPLQLEGIIKLSEVEKITSLSRETIERRYPKLIVRLSPRRSGMKLKHALAITTGTAAA